MTEEIYNNLNSVDKFVVDNYDKFKRGLALDNISIKNHSQTDIIKKLNYTCTAKRMTQNAYRKLVNNNYETIPDKQRFSVYTIKPKEQIPDIYNIIEYIKENNINTEELNKNKDENNDDESIEDIITKNKRAEEDIITKNEMLFRYGVKTKWLNQLGIKYSREFLDYWFHTKRIRCDSKYGKTLPEKYKNLGIKEEIYAEDFKKKYIKLYRLSYLP